VTGVEWSQSSLAPKPCLAIFSRNTLDNTTNSPWPFDGFGQLNLCNLGIMAAMQDLLHALLNPSPLGLAIAILLAITIPIFLHSVVFRSSGLTTLPSILLIGPSSSGKTSLITLVSSSPYPT